MDTPTKAVQQSAPTPLFGAFLPLPGLWDESNPARLFPSEASARWFVKTRRPELVKAGAILLHLGQLHFHQAKFSKVVERLAIKAAA